MSKCYGRHLVGGSKGLLPRATSSRPTMGFLQGSLLAQWPRSLDGPWQLLSNLYLSKESCPNRHPALLGRISSVSLASHLAIPSALPLAEGNSHVPVRPHTFLMLPAALPLSSWAARIFLCQGPLGLQAGPISVSTDVPNSISSKKTYSGSHLGPQLL